MEVPSPVGLGQETLISHARDHCVMDVLPWVGWVGFRGPFIGITSRSTFQIRSVFDKHLYNLYN